jgi:molecular chaperone DnaK
MQILPSSGLADEEIDNMVREAEQHASADAQRKESVEATNLADSAKYSAEKFLRDNGDKISEAQRNSIQAEIDNLTEAMGGTPEAMQAAVERLQQALQEVGTSMYQQQEPPAGDGSGDGPASEATPDEDVVEGEFSEE